MLRGGAPLVHAVIFPRRLFARTALKLRFASNPEEASRSNANLLIPLDEKSWKPLMDDPRTVGLREDIGDEELAEELGIQAVERYSEAPPKVIKIGETGIPDIFGIVRIRGRKYVPGREFLIFKAEKRVLCLSIDAKAYEPSLTPVAISIRKDEAINRIARKALKFEGSLALRLVKEIERGDVLLIEAFRAPAETWWVLRGIVKDPLLFIATGSLSLESRKVVRLCSYKALLFFGRRPVLCLPKLFTTPDYSAEYTRRIKGTRAIISDMDGVLLELDVDWQSVISELRRREALLEGESLINAYFRLAEEEPSLLKEIDEFIAEKEISACKKVRSDKDIRQLIVRAKSLGMKFAVVSKQKSSTVKKCLERLGIIDLVDAIVGREFSMLRKEQIAEACRRLGVTPARVVVLGDRIEDMTSAIELGAVPVMVSKRFLRRAQFRELGGKAFKDVKKALRWILKLRECE